MAEEIGIAAASEVASKVTESVYDFIQRQISYVFKYQRYVDGLKNQFEDLGTARERVKHQVEEAERQGDEIEKDVEQWLKRVDDFTEGVVKPINDDEDKAKKRCFKGLCPNFIKRYKLSKKAAKAAEDGAALLVKGKFHNVSHRSLPRRTKSIYVNDDCEPFDSRMLNFQEIMEALKDSSVNTIGVHGMGGVGKTTLVKKVAWQAEEEKLFDKVVTAEVTQTTDLVKIQGEIADQLGLVFKEESVSGRADRLRERLKKERRVLIILDNIWRRLDLKAVGVPLMNEDKETIPQKEDWEGRNDDQIRRCTILLTSRNRDVLCKDMKTKKNIFILPLSYEDARNFFWKIVGDSTEKSEFHPIAAEIVEKCAGLPIAISTIANALKTKSLYAWEDALAQLKMSNPRCIPDIHQTLYSTIELSYKFLEDEEAKQLFLLCTFEDPGRDIFISDLLKYCMGLNLFRDVYKLEKGRNRLHTLIDHLKASSLLLNGVANDTVKMHDIIHAVAVSIAYTDKFLFNIQNATALKEVLEEKKDSVAISLSYIDIYNELPENLECPKLKLFLLCMKNHSLQIPDHFCEGMKELKVLDFTGMQFLSLPSSLCYLKSLRTLCLDSCVLRDVAIVGELKALEILSFLDSDIGQLPSEIGQLTRLKMLDLSNCIKLKVIAPNVISSLSRLEELYMGNSFVEWETEGGNNQGQRNASLGELKKLSHLTALHIHIPDARIMPQDLLFEQLKSYKIFIGDKWNWPGKYDLSTSRTFKLKINDNIHLWHGVRTLLKRTEDLYLDEMNGVRNVVHELDGDGFPHLKHLHARDGLDLLYIVHSSPWKLAFPKLESLLLHNLTNLEKVFHGQFDAVSFSKLRIIKIEKCERLKYLFSSFMAESLSQLQEMEVSDCKNLREIFGKENEEYRVDEIESNCQIEFTQLRTLTLQSLPQFISFGFNVEVLLRGLENLKLSSIYIENIWLGQHPAVSFYSQGLKSLTVEECNGLKFLFSSSMVKSLMQLQELVIGNCNSMEAVIKTDGLQGEKQTIFPKLFYLKLKGLPNLTRFGTGNLVEFPSLKELHIESCSNLKKFLSNSSCADTMRKKSDEENLENCLTDINRLFDEKVAFPSLEKMTLMHLDNLQLIWHNQLHADSFCKLKVMIIECCEKLITIVPSNIQGLVQFENLETLNVEDCRSIKSLFPVSIATRLMKLKVIKIVGCGLEEIVAKEDVEDPLRFLFPELTHLILQWLPELKYFYLGLHTTVWPVLHHLTVIGCKKLKIYASEFQKTDGENQPALFVFEKVIHALDTLGLSDDSIASICLDRIPATSLCKLKHLWLFNFDEESEAFRFGFFQKLYCLETFHVFDSSFKELFPYEGHTWKQDSDVDSFLQNLEFLEVGRCHHLKSLNMSPSASFTNLTTLIVQCCDGLENIFACSTVKRLVQLKEMRIKECKLLAEVIANEIDRREEEMVFCQLKVLELHRLSSLTCFCSTNYDFKFPCLEQAIVSECPKLKIFSQGLLSTPQLKRVQLTPEMDEEYFWNDDLNSTIQQIFTDMVGFRNLEHLKLSEFPTLKEKIRNDQVPVEVFWNLKSLVVDEFSDMSCAIQSNVSCHLKNLNTLEVQSCDSLYQVFDMEGQLNDDGHSLGQSGQQILGFNNLKWLKVHNCHNLRYIFTPSIILALVQLQEIEIVNCALIEEIITKEGEKDAVIDKIRIPQLNAIRLKSLPNLTTFYSGSKILEFPPVEIIIIKDCQKIHMSDFNLHLASFFIVKVVFPTLEDLTLSSTSLSTKRIWNLQLPAAASFFQNLTVLVIDGFDHLKYLFLSSMVKSLFRLEKLEISNCKVMEVIIDVEEGINNTLFPKLSFLYLEGLPSLTRFCNSKENLDTRIKSLFDEKVRLPSLETLKIRHVDELGKIWDDEVSLDSFCKLNWLRVAFCNKLVNIFPSNMFGIHQKLSRLVVENCDSLEEIFKVLEKSSCMVEEIVAKKEVVPRFVFSELTLLHLKKLPSLKSLYPDVHISEWPVFKSLRVFRCDQMKIFTSEFLSFGETYGECQHEIPIQRPLFSVDKVAFRLLKELQLGSNDSINEIWQGKFLEYLCNIKFLKLKHFSEKDAIFPSCFLHALPGLKKLVVSDAFFKEIFSCQLFCSDRKYAEAFSKFRDLKLSKLPELLYLCKENSQPCRVFQNLETLEVSECGSLKSLVPSSVSLQNLSVLEVSKCDSLMNLMTLSTAKSLVKLTKMNISDCKMIEEIFMEHDGDEVKDQIVFRQLKHLGLNCLPSLTSFCLVNCSLEFPSLQQVIVCQCSKMKIFSQGVSTTPKLERLQLEEGKNEGRWEGNLNSTIQQLFKEMNEQSSKED